MSFFVATCANVARRDGQPHAECKTMQCDADRDMTLAASDRFVCGAWANVWPRRASLPSWQCGCDIGFCSQRARTSCDVCNVKVMSFIVKPSPQWHPHDQLQNAIQTPRTNHPVKRPAKYQWPVDHVVHVPFGALRASDDGTRCEIADTIRARRIDTLRTLLSSLHLVLVNWVNWKSKNTPKKDSSQRFFT